MSNNIRSLGRLIERLEEFLDDFKIDLEADEIANVDEIISVIDRLKSNLESENNNDDDDE